MPRLPVCRFLSIAVSYLDDVLQRVARRGRAVHLGKLLLVLLQLPNLRLEVLDLHAELDQQVIHVVNAALAIQAVVSLLLWVWGTGRVQMSEHEDMNVEEAGGRGRNDKATRARTRQEGDV